MHHAKKEAEQYHFLETELFPPHARTNNFDVDIYRKSEYGGYLTVALTSTLSAASRQEIRDEWVSFEVVFSIFILFSAVLTSAIRAVLTVLAAIANFTVPTI
ncbi:uncharacterized protein PAC_14173 [Phialocephala subalpina]|uniref:Uncharacterized protein n=1 Tax=Phialocephala subalpina TaxID=576137 RepID=A0A1L7XGU7_9HELO|nr:uncharacterized protein PAC_14173 [Phialocephala subalpina]